MILRKAIQKVVLFTLTVVGTLGGVTYYFNDHQNFKYFILSIAPGLLIYYVVFRKVNNLRISLNIILGLSLLFISDVVQTNFFKLNINSTQLYQIFLMLIVQFFYILEYRKEGSRVIQQHKYDILKIVLPAILVFFLTGFIFLDQNNPVFYILMFFTALEVFLMIILSLFRPVGNYSFYVGFFGVSLMFFSDLLYVFYYFKAPIEYLFNISILLYFVSQILIIEGFTTSSKS